ncbi:Uncharacterised protein [Mycobacteroides abscessus subsp. abscessus]|nr:Uncharacterised protein [Mycobacteroides abscessus subsp. abscessus]
MERSCSPAPVPYSGSDGSAPTRNRVRMPGRSGRRDFSTDSQAGTSVVGSTSRPGTSEGTWWSAGAMMSSNREATARNCLGASTASTSPCSNRFSAVWTPSGNCSP